MSAKKKALKVLMIVLAVFVGLVTVAFAAYYVYEHREELPVIKDMINRDTDIVGEVVDQQLAAEIVSPGSYTAEGEGVKTGSTDYLSKFTWKYSITAYTCDDDPLNATWRGTWDWRWESVSYEGQVGKDDGKDEMEFTTVDGQASYNIGDTPVTVDMSNDSFTMSIDFKPLGVMTFEGTVEGGSDMCEE